MNIQMIKETGWLIEWNNENQSPKQGDSGEQHSRGHKNQDNVLVDIFAFVLIAERFLCTYKIFFAISRKC